jgi:hypothetical protein
MSNQQTTKGEVSSMRECKHEDWGWRIIPDSEENYQAVYCDICDQMLAQVGQDNKTVTETAKPQTKEKAMKESNLGRITCTRCEGTGQHSFSSKHGTMCYGCLGTGTKSAKPMTDSQVKYIRSLFAQVKEAMTIDEQESLVTKMKAHLDKTNVLTTVWASSAIAKLKTFQKGR